MFGKKTGTTAPKNPNAQEAHRLKFQIIYNFGQTKKCPMCLKFSTNRWDKIKDNIFPATVDTRTLIRDFGEFVFSRYGGVKVDYKIQSASTFQGFYDAMNVDKYLNP